MVFRIDGTAKRKANHFEIGSGDNASFYLYRYQQANVGVYGAHGRSMNRLHLDGHVSGADYYEYHNSSGKAICGICLTAAT